MNFFISTDKFYSDKNESVITISLLLIVVVMIAFYSYYSDRKDKNKKHKDFEKWKKSDVKLSLKYETTANDELVIIKSYIDDNCITRLYFDYDYSHYEIINNDKLKVGDSIKISNCYVKGRISLDVPMFYNKTINSESKCNYNYSDYKTDLMKKKQYFEWEETYVESSFIDNSKSLETAKNKVLNKLDYFLELYENKMFDLEQGHERIFNLANIKETENYIK